MTHGLDFLLFQVASVSALVGMTLGWRGVMTRYSGFYDLPTAWSNVFWGILIGGFYASFTYNNIVLPYIVMVNDRSSCSCQSSESSSPLLNGFCRRTFSLEKRPSSQRQFPANQWLGIGPCNGWNDVVGVHPKYSRN
jgi:hypothetical protein